MTDWQRNIRPCFSASNQNLSGEPSELKAPQGSSWDYNAAITMQNNLP
jgi:hypothetical protein